jgi:hypothetical protein
MRLLPLAVLAGATLAAAEIPAGTPFAVRVLDSIDSRDAKVGDSFRATLDERLVVQGREVAPRGARVTLKLVEEREAGRISGRNALTIAASDIEIDGRAVPVSTSSIVREGKSKTKKTAGKATGGAILGAIIGGIAGGGRGAAIGAASGAGAGAGWEALKASDRVRIPSETRLRFTLQDPVRVD